MNTNRSLMIQHWQDDTALERFQMISRLVDTSLDPTKRVQLRHEIAAQYDVSYKTIKRYDDAYQKDGFEGLKPKSHGPRNQDALPENFEELLEQAIQLRREVPSRSVDQIITILELERQVEPGVLKRSTLQRHLYAAGFGSTHLKTYKEARDSSSKRFCKPHRMMLIQGDIKYGPVLPIGENGRTVQTYLSSAIDDHSRMILASQFYDNQEETVVEDRFDKAILKFGTFDACYFDYTDVLTIPMFLESQLLFSRFPKNIGIVFYLLCLYVILTPKGGEFYGQKLIISNRTHRQHFGPATGGEIRPLLTCSYT